MNEQTENADLKSLTGVIVPVITPVDQNENVDEKAYRAVIRRCLNAGVRGIFAGGSAGMGPLLSDGQWQRAMEIAYDEVGKDAVMMGGVIATSTRRALDQIAILDRIGFSTMVVTPTYYIALRFDDEFMMHFAKCRQATSMEMVIYNIPSCTNSQIPAAVVREMAERKWFSAFKESSGSRFYFEEMLAITEQHGISIFQGNEPDIEWGLAVGAAGIVPVCANYEPETFVAACNAAQQGDLKLLAKAQQRISKIREALLLGQRNWISGIMYGVSSLGIGSGRPIQPLQELPTVEKASIDALEPAGLDEDKFSVKHLNCSLER
jgi:4-hydroxy-tetrahydrodipicolinate synthase